MPVHQTRGAKSAEAFGFGAGAAKVVTPGPNIEQIFSTYLYTGTGASQTITNNLALSTNGGMVWIKDRTNAYNHNLFSTTQTATKALNSNTTNALTTDANSLTAFGTTGFTLGSGATSGTQVNVSSDKYVSWSFCKQANFFDIQTYTGNGTTQAISHSLTSAPGCILVKRTDTSGTNWAVYHNSANSGVTPQNYYSLLNSTATPTTSSAYWNNTAPTATNFTVGSSADVNTSGGTYVAYLFGPGGTGGFTSSGTADVISCGFVTTNSSGLATVSLGFEPQFLLIKPTTYTSGWYMIDVLRQFSYTAYSYLYSNANSADTLSPSAVIAPTSTGFTFVNFGFGASVQTFMYVAIRRGPQGTISTATSLYTPYKETATANPQPDTTTFTVDTAVSTITSANDKTFTDRLRGGASNNYVTIVADNNSPQQNISGSGGVGFDVQTGLIDYNFQNTVGAIWWNFARAPGFFDTVYYTGTGAVQSITHNLGVVPQLMIIKLVGTTGTTATGGWVYHSYLGNTNYAVLQSTAASASSTTAWNSTTPTASVFTLGADTNVNPSGITMIAYLFATLSTVSYVGSYTGTGGTQSIACGFGAGGARFLLAKRTNSTSSWCCWDSANGLTSSSSPYYAWESYAGQTTGNNGTYASSGGFTLTSASPVNASGGTYIFLAIA